MNRVLALLIAAVLNVAAVEAAPVAADRKPLPPANSLETAKRLVVDTFRKELSAPDKVPAIRTMLQTAAKTKGDDAAQAALYLTAADVAARAGETKLAFEALTRLAESFDADLLALKRAAMDSAASHAQTTEARISVANRCLELADDAAKANRLDLAGDVLKTALAVSSKVRDAELRRAIADRRRELQKAIRETERIAAAVAAARTTLEEKPNDPDASEVLGKHLCFDKNDWAAGLKLLANVADRDVQKAALADQSGGTEAGQMTTLGDWWWALAEAAGNERDQAGYKSRAVFWYTRAVGGLTGFAKTRVEKRIIDAGQAALAAAARQDGGENGKFIDVTLAPGVAMRLMKIPASADGKIKEFYLGRTEVTQKQWQAVMGSNPSAEKGDELPVTMMTYKDCLSFCDKLNSGANGGRFKFRIPSEEELHYACFLGMPVNEAFPGEVADYAWFNSTAANHAHPAAQKKPNRLGIYDLLGNVWEWTSDETNLFGGSFDVPDWYCRKERLVTPNGRKPPGTRWINFGIRLAADSR